ncbi:hypothetical protein D3C76_1102120 [compost metagenome]
MGDGGHSLLSIQRFADLAIEDLRISALKTDQLRQPITFGIGLHAPARILDVEFDGLQQLERGVALFTLYAKSVEQWVDILRPSEWSR